MMNASESVKTILTHDTNIFSDAITLLRSRGEMRKTLKFEDGQWTKTASANAKHFDIVTRKVDSLDSPVGVLRKAKSSILIHGAPLPSTPRANVRRTTQNFAPVPHSLILFDLDALEGPADPAAATTIARGLLPEEFHAARCAWNATSGHALKEGEARLRLIFWTDRPISLDETRVWAARVTEMKIDRSIYRAVQPVFIEAPKVIGAPDPVPQRWGFLDGQESVRVPDDLAAEATKAQERKLIAPANVAENSPHMLDRFAKAIESRSNARVESDGRRNSFRNIANDAFDYAVTEDIAEAAIESWFHHDDDSEAALVECLVEHNVADAATLAARIRAAGEKVVDSFDGEALPPDAIAKQVDDAAHSRTSPVGSKYLAPLSTGEAFGAVLSVDEALENMKRDPSERNADALVTAIEDSDMGLSDAARAKALVAEVQAALVLGDDPAEAIAKVEKAIGEGAEGVPPKKSKFALKLASDFVAAYTPLEYVLDGIIVRGSVYTLTAKTGAGKTTLLTPTGLAVATGREDILGVGVERGNVVYLTFENPDDYRMKLIAAAKAHGSALPDSFLVGDMRVSPEIIAKTMARDGDEYSLIVVDTLQAAYDGDDFNDNKKVLDFVSRLRKLTQLPGRPAVVIAAHPIKNATKDSLVPYGGGAVLNEVDGNLTLWRNDGSDITTLHWQGKFRGAEFAPMDFQIVAPPCHGLLDAKGRVVKPPVIRRATEAAVEGSEAKGAAEAVALLKALQAEPGASNGRLAERAGLSHKEQARRRLVELERAKLVEKNLAGRFTITDRGRKRVAETAIEVDPDYAIADED